MHQADNSLPAAEVEITETPAPDAWDKNLSILPIAITLAVQALVSMTAVAVPVFMPVVAGELQFPASYVGIFVTIIYLGATLAAPVSGYFIDRFGAISVSQICLFLCALGLALLSCASIPWMVSGALIIGFGYGPVTPASTHLLVRTTPVRLIGMVFSIKQTGVPIGGALAGFLVPHLVLLSGWRTAAIWLGAISIVSMLLLLAIRKRFDQGCTGEVRISWGHLTGPLKMTLFHQGLRQVVVASFFFATMQLCLISFMVTYLTDDIKMTLVRAGIMLAVAQSAGIIGRIVWGALADKCLNPRIMLAILGIAMAATAFLAALFTAGWPHAAVLIVCALFGSVAIGWNGVYLAEVARLVKPEYAGAATGGSLFFTFCGVLIGLPIFSMIVESTGSYRVGFLTASIATAICGAVLCLFRPSNMK